MLIYEGKVSRFERFVSDGEFFGKKNLNFKSGLMNGFVSGSILVGGVLF